MRWPRIGMAIFSAACVLAAGGTTAATATTRKASTPTAAPTVELRGRLQVVSRMSTSGHFSTETYLKTTSETLTLVVPGPDQKRVNTMGGRQVRVRGTRAGSRVRPQTVAALDAARPAAAMTQTRRIAVVMINARGQNRYLDPASYEKQFFGTGPMTVAAWFKEASDNQVNITGRVYGWYNTDLDPNDCDMGHWTAAAEAAAARDGYRPENYEHIVMPLAQNCNFSGALAYMPGRAVALLGLGDLDTLVHELGHNLGLPHSSSWECGDTTLQGATPCTRGEYGDPNDVMGVRRLHHYHGYNKYRIGWMSPDKVATVSATGQRDIDLTSSERVVPGATQLIMVPLPDGSAYAVERRELSGQFDQGPDLAGVWIRMIPKAFDNTLLLDMTPNSQKMDFLDANLTAGRWFTDAANNVSISTTSDSGPTARIRICRPACMPITPPPLPPVVNASLVGSTVVVTGTAGNDGVSLQKYRNTIIVRSGNYARMTAGPGCTYANWAVTCTGRKLNVVVNLGAGDDSVVTPSDKVTTVINAGDGNDLVLDFAGTDIIHGGNGTDTVDYSYRKYEGLITGTPGTGADDGTTREHDDIGSDVERVTLPPPDQMTRAGRR